MKFVNVLVLFLCYVNWYYLPCDILLGSYIIAILVFARVCVTAALILTGM